jgi:hypothetical protein
LRALTENLSSNFVASKNFWRGGDVLATVPAALVIDRFDVFVGQIAEILQESIAGAATGHGLLGEFGNSMGEPRNFAAGIILMHDAALGCAHDDWFRLLERRQGRVPIAARDSFLDFAD